MKAAKLTSADKGILAVGVVLLIPIVLWRAWVVATIWGWFLVPLGVPAIGLAHALGLGLMVRMFVPPKVDRDTSQGVAAMAFKALAEGLLYPLFALAFGSLIASFMP